MKNILFSTTRQFNAGDGFILMGIENLLKSISLEYNAVIANRHPIMDKIGQKLVFDNSFGFRNWDIIDYVVFAGSPAWWQNRPTFSEVVKGLGKPYLKNLVARYLRIGNVFITNELIKGIIEHDKRCSFLGVGIGTKSVNFTKPVREVLKEHTDVLIVRNQRTYDWVPKRFKPILLPCPALYAADNEKARLVTELKKVLFIVQGVIEGRRYNGLDKSLFEYFVKEYWRVKKAFPNVKIACFAWQDYARTKHVFGSEEIIYDFRAEDWADLIVDFDFVVSSRVHGCGLASSLYIPNIMLNKCLRATTAEFFLSKEVEEGDDILKIIKNTDVQEASRLLKEHKESTADEWRRQLKKNLSILK